MCGRYTLTDPGDLLVELGVENPESFEARYNIAPTQEAPIVRTVEWKGPPSREVDLFRWGLVPFWAEDPSIGSRMINARSETAAAKPAFREALRQRRCLVPADGFYEWRTKPNGSKQPYRIRAASGRPFVFAGLWERWGRASPELLTFTILTTDASPAIRDLHDRMPVILDPDAWDLWLDPRVDDPELLRTVLRPWPDERIAVDPVSRRVNSVEHDDAACIAPIELEDGPERGEQLGLF